MTKRFAYIVLFMVFMPVLSFAYARNHRRGVTLPPEKPFLFTTTSSDTTKTKKQDDKPKIKEIGKAKRQPKPEKLDEPADNTTEKSTKPKRQRRPEGLERPPEIPRRSGGG